MSERAPCVRCGLRLFIGEPRALVSFTEAELEELAFATSDPSVADRLLCALGILNPERERKARAEERPR